DTCFQNGMSCIIAVEGHYLLFQAGEEAFAFVALYAGSSMPDAGRRDNRYSRGDSGRQERAKVCVGSQKGLGNRTK
ncbi:MAG TPA: hypothetical protein VES69_10465, partial [Pyrinomonadaceae bacterium]|nr:hypothetical protein [Pyrinomonadaceae bacterium]